jgi:hypothetical protein
MPKFGMNPRFENKDLKKFHVALLDSLGKSV